MSIRKDAVGFAKEMIEHGYLGQMTPDDIVNKSCELAYKIHEKTKQYELGEDQEKLSKKDIARIAEEIWRIKLESPKPTSPPYHP